MRIDFRGFRAFIALLVLMAGLSGCGITAEVDNLVALYNKAQTAASDYRLCVDTIYLGIKLQFDAANAYLDANVEQQRAWQEKVNAQLAQYQAAAQQQASVQPNQLDLSKPENQPQALGAPLFGAIGALVQPPPAPIPAEVTVNQQRILESNMLTLQQCGKDWNAAVNAYNTRRSSVGPTVIAQAAQKLGFDLPASLPRYEGSSASQGPIGDPRAPTPTASN